MNKDKKTFSLENRTFTEPDVMFTFIKKSLTIFRRMFGYFPLAPFPQSSGNNNNTLFTCKARVRRLKRKSGINDPSNLKLLKLDFKK